MLESVFLKNLKKEHHVDLVVALTHNWGYNDSKLATEAPLIDLILGGHNHEYSDKLDTARYVKSGADFEFLTRISVTFYDNKVKFESEKIECTEDILEDVEMSKLVDKYTQILEQKKRGKCWTR